jgi:hypothetical protein
LKTRRDPLGSTVAIPAAHVDRPLLADSGLFSTVSSCSVRSEPAMVEGSGCAICWPDDADAAWLSRASLEQLAVLVEESHHRVVVERCPRCAQRYLYVFCETIDWVGGEDPQFRSLLPLTDAEAEHLLAPGAATDEATLAAIAPARRSLARDFCREDAAPRTYWSCGVRTGPHD